jgi:hypothetical protein
MKARPPLTKIEMIERSMRCLVLGLFGLLPVVGIPMALLALRESRRVKFGQGAMWNPANRYRVWGCVCARLGLWPILIIGILMLLIARFS